MGQKSILKNLYKQLNKVKSYQAKMAGYSDKELAGLTIQFKKRLAQGVSLDELLPEAYAAICEADKRVLGMSPYDAQILGGIALHQGYLAEMNTGEGKTLVATMPLYLNALTGNSTILVTTNEYLALRDANEMGPVYEFMGLSVAAGAKENKEEQISNQEKKEIYSADIVYSTHGAVGFDYLFNNLVTSAEERFMRPFGYIIIDEADSVLLDAANTPLVISASPRVQSNLYKTANFFVTTLEEDVDYEKEDKKVWLTDKGIKRAERYFQIDNFYSEEHFEINRHVTLALRAHVLFEKEKDYMISRKGELYLLDRGSGRSMPGVKLRGGLHQAIETKEGIEASQENRSVASITYQNLFKLFPKMAGMSGTIADAKDELYDVYGKKIVLIPPNKAVQRIDYPDKYYKDATSQFLEAVEQAIEVHKKGQPVLFVVSNIRETEIVSSILVGEHVPHSVLNATNAFWEADVIKEAGQMGAVTVATSMAGRGTDIKLGEGVRELGGLAVIGIGRLANTRLERQARGRAGRQGDAGFSQFYVSLEDEVVASSEPVAIEKYIEKDKPIGVGKLKKIINRAQRLGEEKAVLSRKQAADYDQIMCRQRELMYETRDRLLDGEQIDRDILYNIAQSNIKRFVKAHKQLEEADIVRYMLDNISYRIDGNLAKWVGQKKTKDMIERYLFYRVQRGMVEQERKIGSKDKMDDFLRLAALRAIDDAWIDQVDYLQQLQFAISGRSTAQRNLLSEYQSEAREAFNKMVDIIYKNVMRNILLSNVYVDEEQEIHMILP